MDAAESKCLEDIERYGCHVINVLGQGALPPFSYSVGIERSSGAPEVCVIGLKHPVAHWMINEYCRRVRANGPLEVGRYYDGFLEGFDCLLQQVHETHFKNHFGWDLWLYKGQTFRMVQLVWPTTSGIWPWSEAADSELRAWQPILTAGREPEFAS